MTAVTRFPIFGRPKLSQEKYLAASSSFAFNQESSSLPEDLGRRFIERIETNLEASRQSVKDAGDNVLAEVVPSSLSINVIGYDLCRPTSKQLMLTFAMPGVLPLLLGIDILLGWMMPYHLTSDEGISSKVAVVLCFILGLQMTILATAEIWRERHDIKDIILGRCHSESEEIFLSLANHVSVITVGGVYLSTDENMDTYTNTFIPWSDIASVKMTHSKNGIELLDAEGETIAGLYHASTPTMTAEVIYDIVLDRLAVKRLR